MATTKQLEHDVDKTRGRIEETISELRERLSPPHLIEEAVGYAQENGGAEFVRNLGRQVAGNPLPVALMGAGLAWLMVTQNRSANSVRSMRAGRLDGPAERITAMSNYEMDRRPELGDSQDSTGMTEKAKEMYGRASETMGGMRDRASEAMGGVRERASDLVGRARETTSGAYEKVSQSMSSAMDTVSSTMPSARGVTNFMQEQPILFAGLGIALGAVIGALLPTTEIEEQYIGPTAESLKEQAKGMARDQWERGKEMAAEGWDEAKEAARRTWEDAKEEAQQSWENTQQKVASSHDASGQTSDMTGVQTPLVPGQESGKEQMADASPTDTRYRG